MMRIFNNIVLLIILFLGNIYISDPNHYFLLIYSFIILYHFYICFTLFKNHRIQYYDCKNFIFISIFLFLFTYFTIYDPNPFFCIITFYSFYPNFIKAVFIIFIHSYFLSYCINNNKSLLINFQNTEETYFKFRWKNKISIEPYFLSFFLKLVLKKKYFKYFIIGLISFLFIKVILFLNRIKIWVYFNKKDKTLPIAAFRNTTFYITSNVVNIQDIIENYIHQLKRLINYLGENNVIVSIVENGDSIDNTSQNLEQFQNYLNEQKVINRFIFDHEIIDDREQQLLFFEHDEGYLRIKFYSQLRNKCLDLLYEIPNLNFSNTKIIFFNDIIFEYENIINLLSTNNEDYDAVCGLDFYDIFYDSWVSIDLSGYSLQHDFPYFVNKEGQDLVINHKPIRVFSCWNGVTAFTAEPLKDRKIQFRYELHEGRIVEHYLNSDQRFGYESECTYFHIDLFSLGYTKTFINPDVRVAYLYEHYRQKKEGYVNIKDFKTYYKSYMNNFFEKRNKYMSNYKEKNISLSKTLLDWYMENRKENEINHKTSENDDFG